jgi:hypothetical protein
MKSHIEHGNTVALEGPLFQQKTLAQLRAEGRVSRGEIRNPKSEGPKEIRNPKPEKPISSAERMAEGFRISAFGFPSDFGPSDFGL